MPTLTPAALPQHAHDVAASPAFLLGQTPAGLWIIRKASGEHAGLFRSREAAIRYVRHECADRNVAIAPLPDDAALEFPPPSVRAA